MAYPKILIVEDEIIIAEDIAGRLKKFGYTVTGIATSGDQAIAEASKTMPDLILMDIVLEGDIDGITAAEIIKNNWQIPVIFLTAYADNKTLQRAKLTEPFGYIVKPFQEKDFYATIEIALQRYEVERKMRLMLEDLENSSGNSKYVSMAVHDLRNPLTVIITASKLLEATAERLDEKTKLRCLHFIQSSSQKMNLLIEDLLIIGRYEADEHRVNPAWINLSEICQCLIEEMLFSTEIKEIIQFVCAADIVAMVDQKLLKHILFNLLSNAIKYSPQKSKVILYLDCLVTGGEAKEQKTPNTRSQITNSSQIIFRIEDQGIGIPKAEQNKLFTPFHRCQNVGKIAGNGLGLAIVKKAVELHCGTIEVESEEGVGTTFTVKIPAPILSPLAAVVYS